VTVCGHCGVYAMDDVACAWFISTEHWYCTRFINLFMTNGQLCYTNNLHNTM